MAEPALDPWKRASGTRAHSGMRVRFGEGRSRRGSVCRRLAMVCVCRSVLGRRHLRVRVDAQAAVFGAVIVGGGGAESSLVCSVRGVISAWDGCAARIQALHVDSRASAIERPRLRVVDRLLDAFLTDSLSAWPRWRGYRRPAQMFGRAGVPAAPIPGSATKCAWANAECNNLARLSRGAVSGRAERSRSACLTGFCVPVESWSRV